jgi:branched-chain amino acid transport system permease protein
MNIDLLVTLALIGLHNGAMIALSAVGISLIFGTVRVLNLAYGDVFSLTTVLVTSIISALSLKANSPPLAIAAGLALTLVAAIAFGTGLNAGIERLAFKPFRNRSRLAPLIATLGLSFVLYQVSLIWRTTSRSWLPGEHRSVPGLPEVPTDRIPDLLPSFDLLPALGIQSNIILDVKDVLVLALAVAFSVGVSVYLRRTRAGRAIRAASESEALAALSGVNYDRTVLKTFAIGGALAGAAAFAFAIYYARPFGQHGAQSGLLAFAAAILGGIGSPLGALAGGLVLGLIAAFSDFYLDARWTPVIVYSVLITLLILRPGGIAGKGDDEDGSFSVRDTLTVVSRGLRTRQARWVVWVIVALALLYPLWGPPLGVYQPSLATGVLVFVLLALGLNIMLGYAGLLDLGYAVNFGVGAYTAALLTAPFGALRLALGWKEPLDFTLVLLISASVAALFGVINALLVARMRSDYLAIVTLAFGLMVRQVLVNVDAVTGGYGGLSALPAPVMFGQALDTSTARFLLTLVVVLVVAAGSLRLIRSRAGRAFLAMGDDELAAASSGVNVAHYKRLAFTLGTGIAGAAGALYASSFGYIDPDTADFRISMMVLAMVVLGGAGSVPGVMAGAVVIALYDRLIIPLLGDALARSSVFDIRQLSYLTFGLAVYLSVLVRARAKSLTPTPSPTGRGEITSPTARPIPPLAE